MCKCRKCNVELVEGENCYTLKRKDYICKPCRLEITNTHKNWANKVKGVYGIFENGVCLYVGESKIVNNRISQHKTYIKNPTSARPSHYNLYTQLSQHKHLIFGVIEKTPNHKERESYWIEQLNPKYNSNVPY